MFTVFSDSPNSLWTSKSLQNVMRYLMTEKDKQKTVDFGFESETGCGLEILNHRISSPQFYTSKHHLNKNDHWVLNTVGWRTN